MISKWTAGLTPEQKAELEANYKASALLRERLKDIITQEVDTQRRNTRKAEAYADASWAFRQADSIGYERALFKILSYISDKNVEE